MSTLRHMTALIMLVLAMTNVRAQDFDPDPRAGAAHSLRMGKQYGYGFDNWGDAIGSINFTHYARAFYNVNPDSADLSSALDFMVYRGVARNLAGGHCFAISSMSLAMNTIGGFHGFCCPTAQYRMSSIQRTFRFPDGTTQDYDGGPADQNLLEAMRVMQNHQLSMSTILTYVDQMNSRVARNGERMMGFFEAAIANEGAALLNVTKSVRPIEGEGFMVAHSMIAYKVERTGLQTGKIFVVDPNRCAQFDSGTDSISHVAWYKDGRNYIRINGAQWEYFGAVAPSVPPEIWPVGGRVNGDVSNGFLLCVPISRVGTAGVSLGSVGLAIGNIANGLRETLAMIFISGSKPHVRQITTPDGRRFYDPATESLEEDEDKRVDRLVPIPLSMVSRSRIDGTLPSTAEVFAADRSYDSITVHATTGADGATLVYMGRGASASVRSTIPNSDISVTFNDCSSVQPSLTIESTDAHVLDIEILQRQPSGTIEKKTLSAIRVEPGTTRISIPMQSLPAVSLQHE